MRGWATTIATPTDTDTPTLPMNPLKQPTTAFAFSEAGFAELEKTYNTHLGKDYAGDLLCVGGLDPNDIYLYSKSNGLLWNVPRARDEQKRRFDFCDDTPLQQCLQKQHAAWKDLNPRSLRQQAAVLQDQHLVNANEQTQWAEVLQFGCDSEPGQSGSFYDMTFEAWRLPSQAELVSFVVANCPVRKRGTRLFSERDSFWTVVDGCILLSENFSTDQFRQESMKISPGKCESHFFCTPLPLKHLLRLVHLAGVSLQSVGQPPQIPGDCLHLHNDGVWPHVTSLLAALRQLPLQIDWRMARLPRLSPDMLLDPNQGYWELFGQDPAVLQAADLRARDPRADLQDGEVAIDFGTSSTVVALQIKGRKEVLRIGATDYDQAVQAHDFENPTVLELVDLEGLLSAWNSTAYRPPLRWDHVRCAHEAQQSLRNNQNDPQRVASIMTRLKQWARREGGAPLLQLADQVARRTLALPTLRARNPSQHQLLEVDAHYEFDPIELYAYFLGLYINWRQRGIFSRYVLSFPVRYKSSVKQNILASFRRGLQRSWPRTLAEQPEALARFTVREGASEPAAYAAAAMPALKLRPSDPGLAYAVFDFGGGTTDFDFGLYRKAITEQEKAMEYSEVFEHFGASGDNDLGGEGLLEILAFRLLQHNRDQCAAKRLCFAHPPVSLNETGLESLLADNQTATTNTVLLVGQLREFWQNHGQCAASSEGLIKLRLIDRDGQPQAMELVLNEDALAQELAERITRGVMQFLQAMHDAFAGRPLPESVQVLLAGNSCRTRWVGVCFAAIGQLQTQTELPEGWLGVQALADSLASGQTAEDEPISIDAPDADPFNDALLAQAFTGHLQRLRKRMQALFGEHPPALLIQPPLPVNVDQMQKPSAKTGVALGLLRLGEGSAIHVIDHSNRAGEARFAHFVGKDVAACLEPVLGPASVYREWKRLGLARAGEGRAVLRCHHTTAPEASSGQLELDSPVVLHLLLEFSSDKVGQAVWLRPIDPDSLEVCCQNNLPDDGQVDVQVVRLC